MRKYKILWVDDEIEMLKPHILFLEEKGYDVSTVTNGKDAVKEVENREYDLIFLDEMMTGMGGLETLSQIKEINSNLPVVMVTKSEEEALMNDAIGSKITDYLIKSVSPSQILMVCKKILDLILNYFLNPMISMIKRICNKRLFGRFQPNFKEIVK